jgi:hypothetical protein
MSSKVARLEDFGARGVVPPVERLKEYQEQSKGLSRRLQARFWLEVLERDHEVAQIIKSKNVEGMGSNGKRRRY